MFISGIKVSNYRAFRETDLVRFQPGINVIIGKNHVGKTALLDVLTLSFSNESHISPRTMPQPGQFTGDNESEAYVLLSFNKQEIRESLTSADRLIQIPATSEVSTPEAYDLFSNWLSEDEIVEIAYNVADHCVHISCVLVPYKPIYGRLWEISLNEKSGEASSHQSQNQISGEIERYLSQRLRNRIYKFDAERRIPERCRFGTSGILKSDASNLPEVLDVLHENHFRYQKFMEWVSTVLPNVKWISVRNADGNSLQIYVWSADPQTERKDLATPLGKCGTGVGQVLSMLYVVFASQEPEIIIIDEPQSFLHPSAIRELIEVFRYFDQHQYIIATHSPLIISAGRPSTITKITHDGFEANLSQVNSEEVEEMKNLLHEVGVRLSDVFGFDRILWVEGPTEENCFPLILESLVNDYLLTRGMRILAVKNTGDFTRKKKYAQVAFNLYTRLSTGQALFPPAVGFLFDREELTEKNLEDLKRRCPRPLEFLPRRLYENYLLDPAAITAVLRHEDLDVTEREVRQYITEKRETGDYVPKGSEDSIGDEEEWYRVVDGAKLLADLFTTLSHNRVQFQKTKHSYFLTEWLIKNNKEVLKELTDFLRNFIRECESQE